MSHDQTAQTEPAQGSTASLPRGFRLLLAAAIALAVVSLGLTTARVAEQSSDSGRGAAAITPRTDAAVEVVNLVRFEFEQRSDGTTDLLPDQVVTVGGYTASAGSDPIPVNYEQGSQDTNARITDEESRIAFAPFSSPADTACDPHDRDLFYGPMRLSSAEADNIAARPAEELPAGRYLAEVELNDADLMWSGSMRITPIYAGNTASLNFRLPFCERSAS